MHCHRKRIDVNAPKITAGRYPIIQRALSNVELELGVVQDWTRRAAPPAVRNDRFYTPVIEEKRQAWPAPTRPVIGHDRYGQEIHECDEKLRKRLAGPSGT